MACRCLTCQASRGNAIATALQHGKLHQLDGQQIARAWSQHEEMVASIERLTAENEKLKDGLPTQEK